MCFFFFFRQKTAYEMRISDWSSDVCSSDLPFTRESQHPPRGPHQERGHPSGRRRSRADPANNLGICIEAEYEPAIIAWRDRREQFGVDKHRDQIVGYRAAGMGVGGLRARKRLGEGKRS